MYCSIDIQTSQNELNTIYVIHERTHAPFCAHPDAHIPHTCTLSLAQYVTPSLSTAFSLFMSLMYNVSVGIYIHTHTCILHTDCDPGPCSTRKRGPGSTRKIVENPVFPDYLYRLWLTASGTRRLRG